MKDLAEILATTITLSGEVQLAFDARRQTDPADTVLGRYFLRLDEDAAVLIGELVYTVAFLTQAHEYLRNAYFRQDAKPCSTALQRLNSTYKSYTYTSPPRH